MTTAVLLTLRSVALVIVTIATLAGIQTAALAGRRYWRQRAVRRMLRDLEYHRLIEEQRRRSMR